MKKDKEIQEMCRQHQWHACVALTRAFSNSLGTQQGVEWTALCEAAYHAGAAKALNEVTFV